MGIFFKASVRRTLNIAFFKYSKSIKKIKTDFVALFSLFLGYSRHENHAQLSTIRFFFKGEHVCVSWDQI